MDDSTGPTTPEAAVKVMRIIWAALIAGQVVFLIVVIAMLSAGQNTPQPDLGRLLFYVALGMMVLCVGVAHVLRAQVFKQARAASGGKLPPARWFTGMILFNALLEGPSLFGIVTILIGGSVFPNVVVSIVPLAVQLANFPTGSAMES
jgi:cytochrome bd-type quinol oxidase subunit 2